MGDSDKYILHGPEPLMPVPEDSLGILFHGSLMGNDNEHEAMIHVLTKQKLSYRDIFEVTSRLASSLQNWGLKKNDVLSVCSENSLLFFYPVIAALYLGVTTAPLNNTYTIRELLHCAAIAKPKIIFCSKNTFPNILKLKQSTDYIKKIVVLDLHGKIDGGESLDDFINNNLDKNFDPEAFEPVPVNTKDQLAFILYSSGTTGLPKGVMITHENILVRIVQGLHPQFMMDLSTRTIISFLPFYHAYGLLATLLSILANLRVIMFPQFEGELFLKTVQDYKVTSLYVVPPLMVFLAKSPLVDKYDLSSVVEVGCGAAPLSKEIEEAVKKRLKLKSVRQGYGLTEVTLGTLFVPLGDYRPGSAGKLIPLISAKVRDMETGELLGPRKPGELLFKGGLIMKGYAGDEEATRNMIDKDGWLATGDVGYYDEEGFFYIVDRLKELIKYKGFQVPPAELEALLLTNPKILDAGVVGLPDELAGELPVAFVVKVPKAQLTEVEVKNFIAKRVSPQKRLHGGVIFVDSIPKTTSGKILRKDLRQMLKQMKSKL